MRKLTNRELEQHILLVFALVGVLTLAVGMYRVFAAGGTDAVTGTLTVNHYCVFTTNTDVSGITFAGAAGLNPGTNTIGTVNTIAVTDTGNLASNILTSGSNWNYNANTFNVQNTIWSPGANTLFSPGTVASNSAVDNEVYLTGTTSDTHIPVNTVGANSIWYGVAVPAGQAPGTYTQTINVISSC